MIKLHIKPLSANEMYLGRKVKSHKYKTFERKILVLLPNQGVPEGELKLTVEVGLSSTLADLDNILKPFIDCLQLKFGFNDKWIYELAVTKEIVKKTEEYITFKLEKREVNEDTEYTGCHLEDAMEYMKRAELEYDDERWKALNKALWHLECELENIDEK